MTLILGAPNSAEARDVLRQLQQLCPEARLRVGGGGRITAGDYCSTFIERHFRRCGHLGTCACICQLVESGNTWTLKAVKMSFDDVKNGRSWPRTKADDSDAGNARPDGSSGGGTGGTIEVPTTDSNAEFDAYDAKGASQIAPLASYGRT